MQKEHEPNQSVLKISICRSHRISSKPGFVYRQEDFELSVIRLRRFAPHPKGISVSMETKSIILRSRPDGK